MNTIFNIIWIVLTVVFGFVAVCLKEKSTLLSRVSAFISAAEKEYEDATKAGGQKFTWVVDSLYSLIPAPFNVIITKELIGTIVQNTFNNMQEFAKSQIDVAADIAEGKIETVTYNLEQ